MKVTYDLVFLLDPKGNELKSLDELRRQPYFVLSGRHILWSLAETPLFSYIKVHRKIIPNYIIKVRQEEIINFRKDPFEDQILKGLPSIRGLQTQISSRHPTARNG